MYRSSRSYPQKQAKVSNGLPYIRPKKKEKKRKKKNRETIFIDRTNCFFFSFFLFSVRL
jgi:hypothetical protein